VERIENRLDGLTDEKQALPHPHEHQHEADHGSERIVHRQACLQGLPRRVHELEREDEAHEPAQNGNGLPQHARLVATIRAQRHRRQHEPVYPDHDSRLELGIKNL
jgi:hypothetical protein